MRRDAIDNIRAVALGEGGDVGAAMADACHLLGITAESSSWVIAWAAASAQRRAVSDAADAALTIAECALAALLNARAGLPPSPWIGGVVARCDAVLGRIDGLVS